MSQGFFRNDTRAKKIQNPFNKFSSAKELNQKLIGLTNKQPKQLKAVDYFEVKKKGDVKSTGCQCCCCKH